MFAQIWQSADGFGWLLLTLVPFVFVQRWLHREIQYILLLLTRRPAATLGLFSLLFFPGVMLHELSHFVMARLLLVRTGSFSLLPQLMPDGKLRLGYVETGEADFLRDSLIGAAPLITGGAAVAYLGTQRLGLLALGSSIGMGNWPDFWQKLLALPDLPDFWLWFYLAFAISSTMLPSASDRRAWLAIALVSVVLVGLALAVGAGPWMLDRLAPWLNNALRSLGTLFGISLVLHLVLLVPLRLAREALTQVTGLRIASNEN